MTSGWPDDIIPPSYAHVGQVKEMYEAIKADPQATADSMLEGGFIMAGTPEDCEAVLDSFQEVGVDQVIVHMQMGGVPHERIMESIELIGTKLIPKYK